MTQPAGIQSVGEVNFLTMQAALLQQLATINSIPHPLTVVLAQSLNELVKGTKSLVKGVKDGIYTSIYHLPLWDFLQDLL